MEAFMTRKHLLSAPLEELEALARREGFEPAELTDREALVEFLLENFEESRRERDQENNPSVLVEEAKYELTAEEPIDGPELTGPAAPEFPEEVALPESYNQTRIVLMARDPHWAFAYWDIDDQHRLKLRKSPEAELLLRVHDLDQGSSNGSSGSSSFDIPVQLGDSSRYIYLPHQRRRYMLELGCSVSGKYLCLVRSNAIRTPREALSEDPPDTADSGKYFITLMTENDLLRPAGSSGSIPQRILSPASD
jgi:hypothetical protein